MHGISYVDMYLSLSKSERYQGGRGEEQEQSSEQNADFENHEFPKILRARSNTQKDERRKKNQYKQTDRQTEREIGTTYKSKRREKNKQKRRKTIKDNKIENKTRHKRTVSNQKRGENNKSKRDPMLIL